MQHTVVPTRVGTESAYIVSLWHNISCMEKEEQLAFSFPVLLLLLAGGIIESSVVLVSHYHCLPGRKRRKETSSQGLPPVVCPLLSLGGLLAGGGPPSLSFPFPRPRPLTRTPRVRPPCCSGGRNFLRPLASLPFRPPPPSLLNCCQENQILFYSTPTEGAASFLPFFLSIKEKGAVVCRRKRRRLSPRVSARAISPNLHGSQYVCSSL